MVFLNCLHKAVREVVRTKTMSRNVFQPLLLSHHLMPVQTSQFHRSLVLNQNAAEEQLIKALAEAFPKATDIAVVDVSGGCGSMYEVHVEAPDFRNIRTVKQHQMVTAALKTQIQSMHGIRISTSPSKCGS